MSSSPSSYKPLTEAGLYEHGQDSAVDLQDVAESSTVQAQLPPTSQVVQDPGNDGTEEEDEDEEDGDTDFESDSAFDSGSLLGDETDTLASSILNHRMENGAQTSVHRL